MIRDLTTMDDLYPIISYNMRLYYKLAADGRISPGHRSWSPHSSAWERLCVQLFEVSTDDDKFLDFLFRIEYLPPPTIVSDELEALAEASGLPDWTHSPLLPLGVKLEEMKYYSIEAPSPDRSGSHHLIAPRDSVEPMPSAGALRTTNELHHGNLRMTDEAVLDDGQHRRTDSPRIKQEPE